MQVLTRARFEAGGVGKLNEVWDFVFPREPNGPANVAPAQQKSIYDDDTDDNEFL